MHLSLITMPVCVHRKSGWWYSVFPMGDQVLPLLVQILLVLLALGLLVPVSR